MSDYNNGLAGKDAEAKVALISQEIKGFSG